jgi:catechol 2,3-dioxygenase-like lactoylglutathione lyase family enzyme
MERTKQNEIPVGWIAIALATVLAFVVSNVSAQLPASPRHSLSAWQTTSASPRHSLSASRVESVGFTVDDMDKSLDFYTRVLPFEKVSDVETWGTEIEHLSGVFGARVRVVRLKLGDEILELTEYLTPKGRPIPVDSRSNDRWFQHVAIIVSDMDKAYALLRANKVRHASTGPQTLPGYITAAAGIRAFYFKDPEDHVLEILSFPADKGAAKWHELAKRGRLFLGIDHTAIVVGNTDTSLKFYRDTLGLTVAGESMNYGSEQEHLNNVFGARLHITGLKTRDAGIAVEFLEYLAPTNGRSYPADSRSNDAWHWQTSFVVVGPDVPGGGVKASTLEDLFLSYKPAYISSGTVIFADPKLGFSKASLVRDPDGHAVRLTGN